MKFSNQILGLVIGVILLSIIVVPIIQDTTKDLTQSDDYTNSGIRYIRIGSDESVTMVLGESDIVFTTGDSSKTLTLDKGTDRYQLCVGDTFSISISSNKASYTSTANTSSTYKATGTFTFDHGSLKYNTTEICTYSVALVPDVEGDLVRAVNGSTKYADDESEFYGIVPKSVIGVDAAFGLVGFDLEGVTEVMVNSRTGDTWTAWTSTTGFATVFTDLDTESDPYTFVLQPQLSYSGGSNSNMSYIWTTYQISHESPSIVASLLSLLPLVMAVGLMYWAYTSFFGGRHD